MFLSPRNPLIKQRQQTLPDAGIRSERRGETRRRV